MTFWSGERLATTPHVVEGFDPDRIDANAYNLSVGNTYFRTADSSMAEAKTTTLAPREAFVIPPGQFAFLLTREKVSVPPGSMAFISMRTLVKFEGLINVSGFHVDPGYSGRLMYSVYNASPSPIQIREGDPLFKIWFADLDQESRGRHLFRGKPVNEISNELVRGMSREILSLQSLSDRIREIEQSVTEKIGDFDKTYSERLAEQRPIIDNLAFIWRAVTITVIAGILVALLTVAFPSLQKIGAQLASALGIGP